MTSLPIDPSDRFDCSCGWIQAQAEKDVWSRRKKTFTPLGISLRLIDFPVPPGRLNVMGLKQGSSIDGLRRNRPGLDTPRTKEVIGIQLLVSLCENITTPQAVKRLVSPQWKRVVSYPQVSFFCTVLYLKRQA